MSTSPSSSHPRTFLPTSGADAGLAEWTSRIKAIQQEVDRDEEAEHRKLQDEIARSRLERARRRHTATGSIEWMKSSVPPSNQPPESTTLIVKVEHNDPLQKYAGSTASPYVSHSSTVPKSTTIPYGTKAESVSLAAFMGGKATGPRLNKPAPQQDSHDPSLFDQTRREGPHPVFGKVNKQVKAGGNFTPPGKSISSGAEPSYKVEGKESQQVSDILKRSSVATSAGAPKVPPEVPKKPLIYRSSLNQKAPSPGLSAETLPPAISEPSVKPVRDTESTTQPTLDSSPSVNHMVPTPAKVVLTGDTPQGMTSSVSVPSSLHFAKAEPPIPEVIGGLATDFRLNKQTSQGVLDSTEITTPFRQGLKTQGRSLPGIQLNSPLEFRTSTVTSNLPEPNRLHPLPQHDSRSSETPKAKSTTSPMRSYSGSKVATSSLARPVHPQANVQPLLISAASSTVSPAFLRTPPSTQDLHPSLSRLKGRGFVEKRVKASAELYTSSNLQQKPRNTSGGTSNGRPSVLDKWPPTITSSTSPPGTPPTDVLINNDKADPESQPTSVRQLIQMRTTSPDLGKVGNSKYEDARKEAMSPVRLPGMAPPKTPFGPSNGVHTANDRLGAANSVSENGAAGKHHSKPLSHPTRDRARKPRRAHGTSTKQVSSDEQPTEESVGPSDGVSKKPPRVDEAINIDPDPQVFVQPPEPIPLPSDPSESKVVDELTQVAPQSTAIDISDPMQPFGACFGQGGEYPKEIVSVTPAPLPVYRPITPTSSPEHGPLSPSRHSRIPSTGQRATVMDVAQALQDHEQHLRESSWTSEPDEAEDPEMVPTLENDAEPEETPRTDVKAAIANWGRSVDPVVQHAERRRSAYDRYSVPTLPPLLEENTPVATPEGSLSRASAQEAEKKTLPLSPVQRGLQDLVSLEENVAEESVPEVQLTRVTDSPPQGTTHSLTAGVSEKQIEDDPLSPVDVHEEQEIVFQHHDKPPPGFNLQAILKETPYSPDPSLQAISVEIFSISGKSAEEIVQEPNVFYDSEVVVVVYRAKDKNSGLVSTNLWAWQGKDAEPGEREDQKVLDFAGRFSTKETRCMQGSEPHEFIHILGGVLAIRQGKRAHWTAENTAMHKVHRMGDSIFVDQVDFAIQNLCSAYSYCLSVLDTLYIWHGRGSSEDERKVAFVYAQSLVTDSMKITELEEGTEDEMFWMMLGDDYFANAYYWRFKPQLERSGARLYIVDCTRLKAPVQLIPVCSSRDLSVGSVFIVDHRLELFVVVPPAARGKRADIQLALILAGNISAATAGKRPFEPPVHVIVLPSKLPLELQASIRLCDEAGLNGGSVPDHMNLLSLAEALEHMHRHSWPRSILSDINFLPLGVDPSML